MKYDPKNYLTQARIAAEELKNQGVDHIDFIHTYYCDETKIITSKAFDSKGAGIPQTKHDQRQFTSSSMWLDSLVRTTNKIPTYGHGFYSYSPANHAVVEVGEFYFVSEHDAMEPHEDEDGFPAPILDENYEDIIKALTWQPDLSDEVMRQYASHKNTRVRQAVASNPNTPVGILEKLAKDSEHLVRIAIAKNPAIPETLYTDLSQDSYSSVKLATAEAFHKPYSVLVGIVKPHIEQLMLGTKPIVNDLVMKAVLENQNFPIEVLLDWYDIFRSQPNYELLEYTLAGHPKTPNEIFVLLSKHQNKDIRQAVAENPKVPLEILFELAKDEEYFVADRAGQTLRRVDLSKYGSAIEKLIEGKETNVNFHAAIAGNETVSSHVLTKLSRENENVRYALAGYGNTPRELLEELAEDDTKTVNNRTIGQVAQERLDSVEDKRRKFWQKVESDKVAGTIFWDTTARSEFATEEFLLSLFGDKPPTEDEEYSQGWTESSAIANPNLRLETILAHSRHDIRQKVARQARATTAQLEQLSKDPAWQVRMEVARNLNTPPHVLELLAKDEHPSVQGAVKQNLAAPRHLLKRSSKIL
jgi:hypothetical protein